MTMRTSYLGLLYAARIIFDNPRSLQMGRPTF